MNERVYLWDNLKFFMIIGIILEHSLIVYGYPRWLEPIWALLISWLMPMFTLISGYWFRPKSVKIQAQRLLKPMILFSAINFFCGYIFYPAYHEGFHVIGYAMWYLWALFVFSIITPIFFRFTKNVGLILLLNALVIIGYCMLPDIGKVNAVLCKLSINRIIGFYPFFLIGIALHKYDGWIFKSPSHNKRMLLPIALTLFTFCSIIIKSLAYSSGFYLMPDSSAFAMIKFFLCYFFIIFICLGLLAVIPRTEFCFTKYGAKTLNVYLLHMLLVFPLSWGIFSHFTENTYYILFNVIVVPLLGLLLFGKKADDFVKRIVNIGNGGGISLYVISLCLVNISFIIELIQKL